MVIGKNITIWVTITPEPHPPFDSIGLNIELLSTLSTEMPTTAFDAFSATLCMYFVRPYYWIVPPKSAADWAFQCPNPLRRLGAVLRFPVTKPVTAKINNIPTPRDVRSEVKNMVKKPFFLLPLSNILPSF